MFRDEFISRFFKIAKEYHDNLSEIICKGSCSDYAQYKYLSGQIEAIRHMDEWKTEVEKQMNED